MSIFGNGVISGWDVSSVGEFTISISQGHGNINWLAARSEFPVEIDTVPPNSIVYVYAKAIRSTYFDESVEFILSTFRNLDDPNFLLLAQVVSGPSSIVSVDNSIRDMIDFVDLIREAIRQHKHRGGSTNPSKIDLSSEVKGQLPAFRIADFDADKITSGTVDLARLPLLDHSELQNVGLLTHPQLDTFVKTLETSNKELFGEIGTANLLQLIIALKLIYDDPESVFYINGEVVDQNMINELIVIPGITPNERIDFENSTAEINLTQHYIQGIPGTVGTSFYVRWEDELAWRNSYYMENLAIVGDTVALASAASEEDNACSPLTCRMIENFDSDPTGGFTQTILTFKDGEFVEGADDDDPGGGQVGEFDPSAEFRLVYVKLFDPIEDWSTYETFIMEVKTTSDNHGAVKYFFVDSTGAGDIPGLFSGTVSSSHKTPDQILLEKDEQTYNSDPLRNDYEQRRLAIGAISFSSAVKGIVLWTDSLTGGFTFRLNDMRVIRRLQLPESGLLKLRYSTSVNVAFSRLEYDVSKPEGTDLLVRARCANGTVLLNRASFTNAITSGSEINLNGTDIEIEITFTPDTSRTYSPILEAVRLLITTDAEMDGFSINTQQEFIRGEASNVAIEDATVFIDPPISVGSYYIVMGDKVLQIHEDTSTSTTHTDGELAIFGTNAPIAPNQIFRAVELDEPVVSESVLYFPRSAKRVYDKSFIIADTYNDRILHFDSDNELVEGFGSINYQASTYFPISACVDVRTGIMYVVWSKVISFKSVNLGGILIKYGAQRLILIPGYDLINNKMPSELTDSDRGQVLAIYLSESNRALASQLPQNGAIAVISANAIQELVNEQSVFYQKATASGGGLPLFIGNFWYSDVNALTNVSIFAPTYAEKTESNTYIITNAKIAVKDFELPSGTGETLTKNSEASSLPSVIEIDLSKSTERTIFTTDFVDFSPFVPGRASRLDDNTLLVAGLLPTGTVTLPPTVGDFDFRTINGSDEDKTNQKIVLDQIFFGAGDDGYVGAVRTVSTATQGGAEIFKYNSSNGLVITDASIDGLGNIVVAESSFKGRSGRIIKLDSSGNIIFSFGEGMYSLINDVEVKLATENSEESIIVSS